MTTEQKQSELDRAIDFARNAHIGQTYADQEYFYHLQKTYEVAVRFKLNHDVQVAAYLHDVLEDTKISFEEIWDEFGWYIAHLVFLVTDENCKNRKERKINSGVKLNRDINAIYLKLCDRIANVEACIEFGNKSLWEMYRKENEDFTNFHHEGEKIEEMVNHLNNLLA